MSTTNATTADKTIDLLQKLLVVELAKQGVPQNDIAKIVGVATLKVNSILKHFNPKKNK